MEIRVTIVTGFASKKDDINNEIKKLIDIGYSHIKLGMNGEHPRDVSAKTFKVIDEIVKTKKNYLVNIVVETNNDAAINSLKVLRFKDIISDLNVIHYNDNGRNLFSTIYVGDSIEWYDYPDGFLDEWPNLMGQTVSPKFKKQ